MTDIDRLIDGLLVDTQLSNELGSKHFREDKSSKSKTDRLVDRILAKNAAKRPELVISILKSHGIDAVYVSGCKYKIVCAHNRQYKAKDAATKTKELLPHKCPELHIKNVEAHVEYYNSVVEFEVD